MRIGIDMRMAGTGEGIARYAEELTTHLAEIDTKNEYYLLVDKTSGFAAKLKILLPRRTRLGRENAKFKTIFVGSPYYSWAEQTKFIWELARLKLDLTHFPSFNVPLFYPGKFVVTIHDVIHHHFPGKKKSRFFHRLAYRLAIYSAARRARRVIAVSQATKNEIAKTLGVSPAKIQVIYEGINKKFYEPAPAERLAAVKQKYAIRKPYLLFVGVWRQYKNLPRLAQAFDILKGRYQQDFQLVLAGKIDPFYPEIKEAVLSRSSASDIKALGFVPDEDLGALYQGATALVLPSLMEGFGLIGAEAQAVGVPVVASDIPVLREILGEGARYFNPLQPEEMAKQIHSVLTDQGVRERLIKTGQANVAKYNWQTTAQETLKIYQEFS